VEVRARVEQVLGRPVARVEPLEGGGYTPALRLRVHLDDSTTAFAKVATNDVTELMLAHEVAAYERLGRQPFAPAMVAAGDGMLVLEDLSHGRWPPPWEAGDVDRVLATMAEVAATPVDGLPRLVDSPLGHELRGLWASMDLGALAGLGVDGAWLDRHQPLLAEVEDGTALDGDDLVHLDLRSDNLCLLPGRVVLVDWNNASRGDARFDLVVWAPSLHLEGGPAPWDLLPDADPAQVALLTGYFADRAPRPQIADAPGVRPFQLAQLRVCLPWIRRLLDLDPPATES
jgi:hypothetical protein